MPTIAPSNTTGRYLQGDTFMGKSALFECSISWLVAGLPGAGHILQHVQWNEKYAGKVIHSDYWECWDVDAHGTVTPAAPDGTHDRFLVIRDMRVTDRTGTDTRAPDKKGTAGKWKTRARVYFVAAADFDLAHWYRRGDPKAQPAAGQLLSRFDPPTPGDGLAAGATLGPVLCTRQFAGTWDWQRPRTRPLSQSRPYPWGGDFDSR